MTDNLNNIQKVRKGKTERQGQENKNWETRKIRGQADEETRRRRDEETKRRRDEETKRRRDEDKNKDRDETMRTTRRKRGQEIK